PVLQQAQAGGGGQRVVPGATLVRVRGAGAVDRLQVRDVGGGEAGPHAGVALGHDRGRVGAVGQAEDVAELVQQDGVDVVLALAVGHGAVQADVAGPGAAHRV